MKGMSTFGLLLGCILLQGCGGGATQQAVAYDVCAQRMPDAACEVSAIELLAAPRDFEGRSVSVVLFYPGYDALVVFAHRDAAEVNDLASAIVVQGRTAAGDHAQQDALDEAGYYRIRATFQRSPPIPVGDGIVVPQVVGGKFTDLERIEKLQTLTRMRAFCSGRPDCTVAYSEGILPIPLVGPAEAQDPIRE